MYNVDWDLVFKVINGVATLFIAGYVTDFHNSRKKLISHYGHVGVFKLKTEENVYTHSVIVSNIGYKPIENVKIGHNFLPENIDIYPPVEYSISNNGKEILIPKLVGKEQITISYLYFPPITYKEINAYIKSDSGFAKEIDTILLPKVSKWKIRVVCFLMMMGCASIIYLIYQFLKLLIN